MAHFTVLFNDSPLKSHIFEEGIVHIGRDDTNDIHIDSLSVALAHAVVIFNNDQTTIRYLNDSFPLFVNGEKTKDHLLANGDKIGIGKHVITYKTNEVAPVEDDEHENFDFNMANTAKPEVEAYLQVTSGKHIGRVISLKKAMNKIGQVGEGIAIIAKRKEGYFISALESHPSMKVNSQTVGDQTIQLTTNDMVKLEGLEMQFYTQ